MNDFNISLIASWFYRLMFLYSGWIAMPKRMTLKPHLLHLTFNLNVEFIN